MTVESLLAENAELHRRLEEAEETLRAIRTGAVDAVVVEESVGHRVYTLEGVDRPYRLFIEEMQQAAATLHADGTILWANRRLADMLQRTLEQLLGKNLGDFVAPDDLATYQELLLQCAHEASRGEVRLQRGDGEVIFSHFMFNTLPADCGVTIGVLITDLTAQRHHDELTASHLALQRSQEHLRIAVAAAKLGQWFVDLKTFEMISTARCKANFGRAASDPFSYAELWNSVHPDDFQRVQSDVERAIAERTDYDSEYRTIWPDGTEHWVLVRGRAQYDPAGEAVSLQGVTVDITQRKQAELELRAFAAHLSDADHRKDEFLATLAHELRNPLAPISNALAIMELSRDDTGVFEQSKETMRRQLSHMVRLIDDLLDISRITRGKIELRRQPVSLAAVLRQSIETSRPAMEAAGHRLHYTPPSQPISIDGDPVRLSQVFSNLLNNSCKYSEAKGTIEVLVALTQCERTTPPATTTVVAENQEAASFVTITVRDRGIGIPPEMLPKVFEMFTQVDHSLERSQGGLGIGLSLVKNLVEMHGGTVEAISAGLGQGSEFRVRLPVVSNEIASEEDASNEKVAAGSPPVAQRAFSSAPEQGRLPKRILVVDDNADSAMSLAMLLKMHGNHTRVAHDGESAVDETTAFRPHLVLLDIGLPKLNGYEAARRIRKQEGGEGIVLVAITGWGQEEDRQKSREAGFNHHLVKPVDLQALRELIAGLPI